MKRLPLLALLLALSAPSAYANSSARGWCEAGNQPVITSGLTSTTAVQGSYSQCTVTVLIHGAGAATIYSDNSNTPLANPFLANTNGQWTFFAINGRYDITLTCVSPCVPPSPSPFPVTYSDVVISDTSTGQFKGPIPWVDVMTYGARPLATNLGTLAQTGTINSGSASLTLSAVGQYQNGDNIVVVGAGTGNSAGTSAPSAPTVTPSVASGPLNTGETAASATGSTPYSYYYLWCDYATDACTPPSAVTTITNGQATLGRATINITSIARSGTAATVTAAAVHVLPLLGSCNTTACPEVQVWQSSDVSFTGFSRIVSTADNTHFVYTTPSSTTYGATTSSTGGQFQYFVGNHIICGTPPNATSFCAVYGRTVGTPPFIGMGRMNETFWDDWGTTISGNPLRPGFVPATLSSTFQNNSLNTTILSGAGTTSVTLAASASTSVTSQYTTIDMCPIIKTAETAALAGGSQLYFPPTAANQAFVNASYCVLPQNAQIRQAGSLWLTAPIALTGPNNNWIANQNSTNPTAVINESNTAPGIYLSASPQIGNSTFDGWNIQSQNSNNALLILSDQGTGVVVKNYNFGVGNGNGISYLGMAEVVRGNGFDNVWTTGSMLGDVVNGGANLGITTAPNLLFANTGGGVSAEISDCIPWAAKGIAQTGNFQMDMSIKNCHIQGPLNPMYTTDSTSSNNAMLFERDDNDSTAAPIFAPLNGFNGTVRMLFVGRSSDTNGPPPIVSGANVADLETVGISTPVGQNFNVRTANFGLANSGTPSISPYQYGSYIVPSGNPSVIGYEQLVTTTSAVVSAGGSVPTIQECYSVAPIYPGGVYGLAGNAICATPTTGNQTVTVNWNTVAIPGILYAVFRSDGGARFNSINLTGPPFVDTFAGGYGQSFPAFSSGGYPSIGPSNIYAPVFGCAETTAPTGIAATDLLYCDSTAHRWKMNNNNAGADTVVGAATTDTLTNKTGITATGTVDFTGATVSKLRVGAGCATAANGDFCYDTTNANWHTFDNAVDSYLMTAPASGGFTNGDAAQVVVATNSISLKDFGSGTPKIEYCGATSGATQNCAKTVEAAPIIIFGDVALNTATTQSITTLPFTSASSYSCSGSDLTTITGIVSFNTYAAASVTIAESGGVNTDHLRYVCAGF